MSRTLIGSRLPFTEHISRDAVTHTESYGTDTSHTEGGGTKEVDESYIRES